MGKIIKNGIEYSGAGASSASKMSYDNTSSKLNAANVQGAIDEVNNNVNEHIEDNAAHVTSTERTKWNGYENAIATNAVNVANNTNAITQLNSDLINVGLICRNNSNAITLPDTGVWLVISSCRHDSSKYVMGIVSWHGDVNSGIPLFTTISNSNMAFNVSNHMGTIALTIENANDHVNYRTIAIQIGGMNG